MNNLREILTKVNGATFAGLDTETTPKLKGGRKNLQQGRVTKRVTGSNVMLFSNMEKNGYEAMVKRRLIEEGKDPESFKLGERTWGKRLPNLPIVEHKGEHYLEVIFLSPGKVKYFLDGVEIDKDEVDGLQESSDPEQGGLSNKVVIRTFKVESIKELRVDHEVFTDIGFE